MLREVRCPVCGRVVDRLVEGVCEECYRKEHPLLEFKLDRLVIDVCRSCGALRFRRGRWHSSVEELEREVSREYSRLIRPKGVLTEVRVGFSRDLSKAFFRARGKASPQLGGEYTEEYVVDVELNRTLCEACLGHISKKKDTLVQIRARGRKFEPSELRMLSMLIEESVSEISADDPFAVPVEVQEKPEGLDVYFSEYSAARKVIETLARKLYFEVLETAKLIGLDGSGHRKYKRTIRLLLPGIMRGDVVKHGGKLWYVSEVTPTHVELTNLDTFSTIKLRLSHETVRRIEVVTHERDLPEALIVSRSGNFLQILDLSSYKTMEVYLRSKEALELLESSPSVYVFYDGERTYLIPRTRG